MEATISMASLPEAETRDVDDDGGGTATVEMQRIEYKADAKISLPFPVKESQSDDAGMSAPSSERPISSIRLRVLVSAASRKSTPSKVKAEDLRDPVAPSLEAAAMEAPAHEESHTAPPLCP